MTSCDKFTAVYDLDTDLPDIRLQYEKYQQVYQQLVGIVGGKS